MRFRWLGSRNSEHTAEPGTDAGKRRINDSEAAALLARYALVEIRDLAWRCSSGEERPSTDTCDRIHFLADLSHNLPGIAREAARARTGRDRQEMYWVWSTAGPDGQAWMLDTIEYADCAWTPPPSPPPPSRDIPSLPAWRKVSTMTGRWPVRTPIGRRPLPASARALKALSSQEIVAVHEEAGERRLGLGSGSHWLRAHLDPNGTHYLVPDPASYYWPDPDGIRWWECRELLRMVDGRQVTTSVAVLPERFAALPDNLPRLRQRRLVHLIRATQYDLYLWGRDHKAECSPDRCGYRPTEPPE